MLDEQQKELERIRSKHGMKWDTTILRKILNIAFLVVALIGFLLYLFVPEKQSIGWLMMIVGMLLKVIEFFIRFLF